MGIWWLVACGWWLVMGWDNSGRADSQTASNRVAHRCGRFSDHERPRNVPATIRHARFQAMPGNMLSLHRLGREDVMSIAKSALPTRFTARVIRSQVSAEWWGRFPIRARPTRKMNPLSCPPPRGTTKQGGKNMKTSCVPVSSPDGRTWGLGRRDVAQPDNGTPSTMATSPKTGVLKARTWHTVPPFPVTLLPNPCR